MKILVIGAPKTGKTRFANKLARENNIKLFDRLPQKFIKKTDLALGEICDYRADFIFVSDILQLEYKNKEQDYIITAGPLYSYCHFLYKANFTDPSEKTFEYLWIMMTMSKIALDSLWYDDIYYIPYKKEDDTFSFYIDQAIKKTIKEFALERKIKTIE